MILVYYKFNWTKTESAKAFLCSEAFSSYGYVGSGSWWWVFPSDVVVGVMSTPLISRYRKPTVLHDSDLAVSLLLGKKNLVYFPILYRMLQVYAAILLVRGLMEIHALKQLIHVKMGIPAEAQCLQFKGKILINDCFLSEY